MSTLHERARNLIAAVGDGEAPTAAQKAELRASVLARVGAAAALGSASTATLPSAKVTAAVPSLSKAGALGSSGVAKGALAALASKAFAVVVIVGVGVTTYVALSRPAPVRATSERAPLVATASPEAPTRALPGNPRAASSDPRPIAAEPTPVEATESRAAARSAGSSNGAPLATVHDSRAGASGGRRAPPLPDPFEAETAALAAALATLHDRRPDEALAALDEQDSLYVQGALGEERAATRIDALCALGRTSEARTLTARFLAEHPRSVNAARVRVSGSCGH